jgi:hypothetical protein
MFPSAQPVRGGMLQPLLLLQIALPAVPVFS